MVADILQPRVEAGYKAVVVVAVDRAPGAWHHTHLEAGVTEALRLLGWHQVTGIGELQSEGTIGRAGV